MSTAAERILASLPAADPSPTCQTKETKRTNEVHENGTGNHRHNMAHGETPRDVPSSVPFLSFDKEEWPELGADALHGLAGRFVTTIEPHTEADRVGLLMDFLAAFGSAVGPGPHMVADGSTHPARLNVVLVGETAKSRKGTTRANVRQVFEEADPRWSADCVGSGLSSVKG